MNPDPKSTAAAQGGEPTAELKPTPVWLFVLLTVMLYGAFLYLDKHAGGFNAKVYEPYASHKALAAYQPKGEGDLVLAEGKRAYELYCMACHQGNGKGMPGQFPPLAESEWVLENNPGRIIRLVLNGIQGPIEVKGQSYNGAMPQHREMVDDKTTAAMITYIRQSWGNTAPAVSPETVAEVREATKDRSDSWTAAELLNVPVP